MLVEFLTHNPQYTPPPGRPVHPDVDFYIWSQVVGGKGPNGCFFGGGNLAGTLRSGDRTLYQRAADGEGGSRQTNLTPDQLETVRQLARRESEEREAALKAQMEAAMKAQMDAMRGEHSREMEAMAKRQADMEEQMRQFMQSFGGNPNSGGQNNNPQNNDDFFNEFSDDSIDPST